MKDIQELDNLGKLFFKARDEANANLVAYLRGKAKSEYGQEMHAILSGFGEEAQTKLTELFPKVIDEALIILLQLLDKKILIDREFDLLIRDKSGELVSAYEYTDSLGSEYEFDDGWPARLDQTKQ